MIANKKNKIVFVPLKIQISKIGLALETYITVHLKILKPVL